MFNRQASTFDGLKYYCRDCQSEIKNKYYTENSERLKEYSRNYVNNNMEATVKKVAAWRIKNPDKRSEQNKKRYYSNISKSRADSRKIAAGRRFVKNNATPEWLSAIEKAQIQEFYDVAVAKSIQTGIKYEVDHIHPLKGNNFTGLHVPWNLQILSKKENRSKSNNLPIEQIENFWRN